MDAQINPSLGPGSFQVGIDAANRTIRIVTPDEGGRILQFSLTAEQAKYFGNVLLRKAADLEQMGRSM